MSLYNAGDNLKVRFQPQNSLKVASKWSISEYFYKTPDRSEEEHRSYLTQGKFDALTHSCISGIVV